MKKSLAFLSALSFATAGFAQAPAEAPGLKVSGFLNYRYEWTQNPRVIAEEDYLAYPSIAGSGAVDNKSETSTQVALFLDNQFDGHTRAHVWLQGQQLSGRTTNTYVTVQEAYVAAKFGPAEVAVGRFLSDVGLGTLGGAPFMDGIHLTVGNKMVTGQVYVTKFGNQASTTTTDLYQATGMANAQNTHFTVVSGDLKVMPMPGLTLGAAYFADVTSEDSAKNYKSWSAFGEYKYVANNVPWLTVQGEYAQNSADNAKFLRNTTVTGFSGGYPVNATTSDKSPVAYFVKAKVLGANPFMVGTAGFSLQYRKADAGFDCMGMADPFSWNAPFNWTSPAQGGCADNHKGFELAGEVTVLPRTIVKAAFGMMKTADTSASYDLGNTQSVLATVSDTDKQNYFTASVFYLF
nr:hypothetical protein [uncultured Holophaga sp.]